MDWSWLAFGVGFFIGISAMLLWACMALAGRIDDEEERRRRG